MKYFCVHFSYFWGENAAVISTLFVSSTPQRTKLLAVTRTEIFIVTRTELFAVTRTEINGVIEGEPVVNFGEEFETLPMCVQW